MGNGEVPCRAPLATPLALDVEERETLERWARRPKTSQALALRSRIVLCAAEGKTNVAVARELGIARSTASKWRGRYLELGPDGLLDEPRPGVPWTITDAQVEEVLTRTLETMPAGATHWSTRSMAQSTGLSQKHDQPHLAGFRAAAALYGELQALDRPALRRKGAGHRRPLHESAGACARPLRRRKDAGATDRGVSRSREFGAHHQDTFTVGQGTCSRCGIEANGR